MKGLWASVKKGATIAVGKASEDPTTEDPEYRIKSYLLREVAEHTERLFRMLQDYASVIEKQSAALLGVTSAFSAAFPESEEPHTSEALRFKLDTDQVVIGFQNLGQTHVPAFCLHKLSEFRAKVHEAKKVKGSRKNCRILMQNQEKKLAEATEKGDKHLLDRQQKCAAQKAEYEQFHALFLKNVDELCQERTALFSEVFHAFVFFQRDMIELQRRSIVETTQSVAFGSLQESLPPVLTKVDLNVPREKKISLGSEA
jgi:hypothetical protein